MPVHDWKRVPAGTFHDLHVSWIPKLKNVLNRGILPKRYYAIAEQCVAGMVPDVLTLEAADDPDAPAAEEEGGTAIALQPPRVSVTATLEKTIYARLANRVTIRSRQSDRVVALIEILSPGNKGSKAQFAKFLEKAVETLEQGIHLLLIDLHPPTRRDPQGIHRAIWEALGGDDDYRAPADKPLTLVSYAADMPTRAFVEPIGVGQSLPPMPVFLTSTRYVELPLEDSYMEAFGEIPDRVRLPLES